MTATSDLEPLFLNKILKFLTPNLRKISSNKVILDGTFGDGGHSKALGNVFPDLKILALDRDQEAIQKGEKENSELIEKGSLQFIKTDFISFSQTLQGQILKKSQLNLINLIEKFNALLFDLGPSLFQLTQSHRGFSFYCNGPLDMRMDQKQKLMASEILNTWSQETLVDLFKNFGEIRNPYRIVNAILTQRKKRPFKDSLELASLVEKKMGWKKKSTHPATQVFQSLRIRVNDELHQIKESFPHFLNLLKPKGLFFVISFHSLEDRIIKNLFKEFKKQKKGEILTPKVIQASYQERKMNSRIRSAKLRVFQKHNS